MSKHFIVNKHTNDIEHGPFPSKEAADTAAKHSEWFDPDEHEVVSGELEFGDEDAREKIDFDSGSTDQSIEPEEPTDADVAPTSDDYCEDGDDCSDEDEHGSHGHFIMHPDCPFPIAGPFETEEDATEFHTGWMDPKVVIVFGMLSQDGNFYQH